MNLIFGDNFSPSSSSNNNDIDILNDEKALRARDEKDASNTFVLSMQERREIDGIIKELQRVIEPLEEELEQEKERRAAFLKATAAKRKELQKEQTR